MSTGIYVLHFNNTEKVYVGQSIDIEARYKRHLYSLKGGTSPKKLQQAYDIYGVPTLEIILECPHLELDAAEIDAISIFNSVHNGFNTLHGGSTLIGINNPQSKYSKEEYYQVLVLLGTPSLSWKEIEKITGVSSYVISHISAKESHIWLKEEYPEEYAKLEHIHSSSIGRRSAYMQGIKYPKIVSPSGVIHEVLCPTHFAKEHNLLQPKLHEVLKGTRPRHKGWSLVGTELPTSYPKVVSPTGEIYIIEYLGAKKFADKFNLTHSNLNRLLLGKQKSHKGWKLYLP